MLRAMSSRRVLPALATVLLGAAVAASCGPKGGTTSPQPQPEPDAGPAAAPDLRTPEELSRYFREIDATPLASASIAQVHAARLYTGEDVVIKVQKPGVEDILEAVIARMPHPKVMQKAPCAP